MRQHGHQARPVRTRIDLQLLRNANEAREVVVLILHRGLQTFQPIELLALARRECRASTVRLRHALGRHSGVLTRDDLHALEILQILLALAQRLLVRVDLADVFLLCAGLDQQIVVDLEADAPHDAEIVVRHQIIDRVDRARRAVLHRHHAVLAEARLDGREHGLKGIEIQHVRQPEQLVARELRIGPRHALAGHRRPLWEQLRCLLDGRLDLLGQRRRLFQQPVLIAPAQLEQQRIERHGVFLQRLRRLLRHVQQLCPLPRRIEHRQPMLLLIGRDLCGHVHPLRKQADQFFVNVVDLISIVAQLQAAHILSVWYPSNAS